MSAVLKRLGFIAIVVWVLPPLVEAQRSVITPPVVAKKAKPAKEWPDARTMAKQQQDAEKRKLCASTSPVVIKLTANFKAVQGDRNPSSTKTFPATLEYTNDDGSPGVAEVALRTRGHMRRMFQTCDVAPLRVEFPKEQVKHSVFDGQKALKLGTHCREGVKDFEQYVLREYSAYRIGNLLTPKSFRARLAKVTYVDAVSKKASPPRYGLFIEDDEDVAKRLGGRLTADRDALSGFSKDDFTLFAMFEYLIGNNDVSIWTQHNVSLVQFPDGSAYPVPYDFDYSGLVDTTYAIPPAALKISSVRDRVYRGPCRAASEFGPFLVKFGVIRPQVAPIFESLTDMDPGAKKRALSYLDEFFKMAEKPDSVKKALAESPYCLKKGLM